MIAFICHPYHRGGVTRWMVDMAQAYANTGRKVVFITVEPVSPFFSAGSSETIVTLLNDAPGIDVIKKKVDWKFEFGTEAYRANVYKELLMSNVPEGTPVILSDDISVWGVSEMTGGHYAFVGVLHADEQYYYDLAKRFYQQVNIWVCVSQRIKDNLYKQQLLTDKEVYVIPCGITLPEGIGQREDKEVNKLQLLYVGRVSNYQKRVKDLLQIAEGLKKEKVNFQLQVVGDGDARNSLEEYTRRNGLEENISFTGWLQKDSIYKLLSQSDLLVLTSDFEGMPVAVMEALGAGCGIVSTRVSGVEDLESSEANGVCIWLNEVGDTQRAVTNIQLAARVSAGKRAIVARTLAETEFTLATCVKRYDDAIESGRKNAVHSNSTSAPYTIFSEAFSILRAYLRLLRVKNRT